MTFKRTPGYAGIIHPSEAEANLSFLFGPLGILSHEAYYPEPFIDGEDCSFRAKTDFQDSYVPKILIETKSGTLNGKTSCASADNAVARFEQSCADGFVAADDYDFLKLMASWSASAYKFKFVQWQTATSGRVVIMVYDKKPPAKTFNRLEKLKVLWCIYGDTDWKSFQQFRLHCRFGIQSSRLIKGHLLEANGGSKWIEDSPRVKLTKKEQLLH